MLSVGALLALIPKPLNVWSNLWFCLWAYKRRDLVDVISKKLCCLNKLYVVDRLPMHPNSSLWHFLVLSLHFSLARWSHVITVDWGMWVEDWLWVRNIDRSSWDELWSGDRYLIAELDLCGRLYSYIFFGLTRLGDHRYFRTKIGLELCLESLLDFLWTETI